VVTPVVLELTIAAVSYSHSDSIFGTVILLILCAVGVGWLGWISVQSLRQALLLMSLPPGVVGTLDGQRVAIHGRVRVLEPMVTPGVGSCLWSRTSVKQLDSIASGLLSRRRRWRTISDQSTMARFALVVNGQETEIASPPTEVQGTLTKRESDYADLLGQLFTDSSYVQIVEWLPVVELATVIGRLERRGECRVVVPDPELGLLLSPHPPDRAARIELLKAFGGLLAVACGIALMIWMLPHR
jgi:hypothetical protein